MNYLCGFPMPKSWIWQRKSDTLSPPGPLSGQVWESPIPEHSRPIGTSSSPSERREVSSWPETLQNLHLKKVSHKVMLFLFKGGCLSPLIVSERITREKLQHNLSKGNVVSTPEVNSLYPERIIGPHCRYANNLRIQVGVVLVGIRSGRPY